jgi:hypothetical protein
MLRQHSSVHFHFRGHIPVRHRILGQIDASFDGLSPREGRKLAISPRFDFMVLHFMTKSNKVIPKKGRGRPPTGRDPVTAIRLSMELRETLDIWAEKQDDQPGRSAAIRRLVEVGLKAEAPTGPSRKAGRASRAAPLAAKAIEKIIDPSAPPEEPALRRRRLTQGPTKFRADRVDLPTVKGKV